MARGARSIKQAGGWAAVSLFAVLALAGTIAFVSETVMAASRALVSQLPTRAAVRRPQTYHEDYLISPVRVDSADAVLQQAVAAKLVPGATIAIGEHDTVLEVAGYGRIGWSPNDPPASGDSTLYDLASLTKAVATTSAVLLLAQGGTIRLDDPVQRWLPEFEGQWKDRVTWRHLLTHTSGLPPSGRVRGKTAADRLRSLLRTKLDAPPGTMVQYSDVSMIVAWAAAQRAAGEPLKNFLERRLWRPLGMLSTAVWPGEECDNCAPTATLHTGLPYRGKPSDPIAHELGVPSGNAGLFSTAHDLGRFVAMIANGGELDGVRIFRPDIVHALFQQMPGTGHRTLGWDAFCPAEHPKPQDPCRHPIAYGHTGWTGTSLWIDPARGVWAVILSNRSYNVKRPPPLDALRENVFLDVDIGPVAAAAEVRQDTVTKRTVTASAGEVAPAPRAAAHTMAHAGVRRKTRGHRIR